MATQYKVAPAKLTPTPAFAAGGSYPLSMPATLDDLGLASQPAIAALAEFNTRVIKSAAAFNAEWFGFLNRRLKEDIEIPARLAKCTSMPEWQQVYVEFWQTAAEQYQEEFERLSHLGQAVLHSPSASPAAA